MSSTMRRADCALPISQEAERAILGAILSGERCGSQKRFTQSLEARGLQRERTDRAKGFTGIGLSDDVGSATSASSAHYDRRRARDALKGSTRQKRQDSKHI